MQQMSALIESWRDQYDYVLHRYSSHFASYRCSGSLFRKVDAIVLRRSLCSYQSAIHPADHQAARRYLQAPRLNVGINAMDRHSPEYFRSPDFMVGMTTVTGMLKFPVVREGSSPPKT